jgi:hypothetical protein
MGMAFATTAEPGGQTAPTETGKHSPLRKTAGDIIRSMALVGAVVAALLLVTWRPAPDPVHEIDPFPVANLAARESGFRVLMPRTVIDDGWRSTSARLEPTEQSAGKSVWFNGWVSPEGKYFAVVQSAATQTSFLDEQTDGGVPATSSGSWPSIAEAATRADWSAFESADGKSRSLVKIDNSHTTVVTTTASWAALESFAGGLVSVKKATAARE